MAVTAAPRGTFVFERNMTDGNRPGVIDGAKGLDDISDLVEHRARELVYVAVLAARSIARGFAENVIRLLRKDLSPARAIEVHPAGGCPDDAPRAQ
jgi:hypothetical protein